uniref:KIB1-4 beta-propeller domain-containing protein n=1 Tax=Arundo donax TaxID=35708 RepID=A0A0A9DMG0_ARUDO
MIPLPPITDFTCVKVVYGSGGNFEHYLFEGGRDHGTNPKGTWFYQKAVLSCSPSKGGDYVVMIIHGDTNWLSFVKAGQSKWQVASTLAVSGRDRYADCVYHDGRFCTLTLHGMVEKWDIDKMNEPRREVVVAAKHHLGPILTRHLVSTPWGDLLQVRAVLAVEYPDGIRFQIHKVDPDGCKKVSKNDFVDHALFLGLNHSACLPTENFPGARALCIYFSAPWMTQTFHWLRPIRRSWGGVRTYDLKRRKFEHALPLCDRGGSISPPPSEVWITPYL